MTDVAQDGNALDDGGSTLPETSKDQKQKRNPKKCSKCGKSVINLSRHQKDVHGMKKLKRKLHDYLSGEKKKPKGMVKFCPLSPCKVKKTPIFQLNKHLQTPLHGLKPDTPSYREALREAPRVSLDFIDDHLKKQKKGGKLRKGKRRAERSSDDERHESNYDSGEYRRSGEEDCRKRVKASRAKVNNDGSEDDKELQDESQKPLEVTAGPSEDNCNDVYLEDCQSENDGETSERVDKGAGTISKDSDQEYDDLARRAWENASEQRNDIVILSDSESGSDYIPGSDSESSESYQSQDSIHSLDYENLMIEMVEVIGKEEIVAGKSFLDNKLESPRWKKKVQEFIIAQETKGYRFKNEEDSSEDLRRRFQHCEESEGDEVESILMSDESDNDDALDEEWEASDGEPDLEKGNESQQGCFDTITHNLITEFYDYMIDVDGGYRNVKIAQQYKSQVKSVIRTCTANSTQDDKQKQSGPAIYSLLTPGKVGANILKSWLSYAVNKYRPGTVRSYLMSLRQFYKFLIQEEKSIPEVSLDLLNARTDLMTSWSSAQKKNILKRKLEKYDEDYRKILSSESLDKICHGNQRVNAVKQLAATSENTDRGEIIMRTINDKSHCEVRDWLMTRMLIDNSGRSGVAAKMTVAEFNEAVHYQGTEEDPARFRVHVKDHKTAKVYGPAVVWIYDDLYHLIDMYIRTVRSQFVLLDSSVECVFVSSNGIALTSSQVSTAIARTFEREGVKVKGKVCATTIRKSLATGMHVHLPDQKEHLAALAQHKVQTQANYYRIHDKINETDLGRRAVKNLVSLKTEKSEPETKGEMKTPALWTADETEMLRELCKEEIETGLIDEQNINKKLEETSLFQTHSFKAVILKLRRLRDAFMENVEPPCHEVTTQDKITNYLAKCQSEVASTSQAESTSTENSRFWRKFTDEQTGHLISLTYDMLKCNNIKREVVWQRVVSDPRSVEIGLITGTENEEEIHKAKQRLNDKVRQEFKKGSWKKKKETVR